MGEQSFTYFAQNSDLEIASFTLAISIQRKIVSVQAAVTLSLTGASAANTTLLEASEFQNEALAAVADFVRDTTSSSSACRVAMAKVHLVAELLNATLALAPPTAATWSGRLTVVATVANATQSPDAEALGRCVASRLSALGAAAPVLTAALARLQQERPAGLNSTAVTGVTVSAPALVAVGCGATAATPAEQLKTLQWAMASETRRNDLTQIPLLSDAVMLKEVAVQDNADGGEMCSMAELFLDAAFKTAGGLSDAAQLILDASITGPADPVHEACAAAFQVVLANGSAPHSASYTLDGVVYNGSWLIFPVGAAGAAVTREQGRQLLARGGSGGAKGKTKSRRGGITGAESSDASVSYDWGAAVPASSLNGHAPPPRHIGLQNMVRKLPLRCSLHPPRACVTRRLRRCWAVWCCGRNAALCALTAQAASRPSCAARWRISLSKRGTTRTGCPEATAATPRSTPLALSSAQQLTRRTTTTPARARQK